MSDVIRFDEIERSRREDSDEVVVYEARANRSNTLFAYLYLNSATYSLVWVGPPEFDYRQPYIFIKQQFSNLPQAEIGLVDFVLPDRRPRSEAAAKAMHFNFNKSTGTLILAAGMNQSLIEYDLLDNENHRQEYLENIRNPEFASRLTFARYDSEIKPKKGSEVQSCFTAESPSSAAVDGWEFAINLPRSVPLRERTLIWVARNHKDEELKRELDFKESQSVLSEKLGLHTRPVSKEIV